MEHTQRVMRSKTIISKIPAKVNRLNPLRRTRNHANDNKRNVGIQNQLLGSKIVRPMGVLYASGRNLIDDKKKYGTIDKSLCRLLRCSEIKQNIGISMQYSHYHIQTITIQRHVMTNIIRNFPIM